MRGRFGANGQCAQPPKVVWAIDVVGRVLASPTKRPPSSSAPQHHALASSRPSPGWPRSRVSSASPPGGAMNIRAHVDALDKPARREQPLAPVRVRALSTHRRSTRAVHQLGSPGSNRRTDSLRPPGSTEPVGLAATGRQNERLRSARAVLVVGTAWIACRKQSARAGRDQLSPSSAPVQRARFVSS
jgi:hypothetical protein